MLPTEMLTDEEMYKACPLTKEHDDLYLIAWQTAKAQLAKCAKWIVANKKNVDFVGYVEIVIDKADYEALVRLAEGKE